MEDVGFESRCEMWNALDKGKLSKSKMEVAGSKRKSLAIVAVDVGVWRARLRWKWTHEGLLASLSESEQEPSHLIQIDLDRNQLI